MNKIFVLLFLSRFNFFFNTMDSASQNIKTKTKNLNQQWPNFPQRMRAGKEPAG